MIHCLDPHNLLPTSPRFQNCELGKLGIVYSANYELIHRTRNSRVWLVEILQIGGWNAASSTWRQQNKQIRTSCLQIQHRRLYKFKTEHSNYGCLSESISWWLFQGHCLKNDICGGCIKLTWRRTNRKHQTVEPSYDAALKISFQCWNEVEGLSNERNLITTVCSYGFKVTRNLELLPYFQDFCQH